MLTLKEGYTITLVVNVNNPLSRTSNSFNMRFREKPISRGLINTQLQALLSVVNNN